LQLFAQIGLELQSLRVEPPVPDFVL
jgi:hypothetical protein